MVSTSATDVDEYSVLLHLGKRGFIDHVFGLVGEGNGKNHEVAVGQQRIQVYELSAKLLGCGNK